MIRQSILEMAEIFKVKLPEGFVDGLVTLYKSEINKAQHELLNEVEKRLNLKSDD